MQHCLAFCQEQMETLTHVVERGCDVENTLEPSLRKAILFSDSICRVSEYVLSWQSMEKSMHYQQTGREMSNPLSQNMIQSFKDVKIESEKHSIMFKCISCVIMTVDDGEIWRCGKYHNAEEWRNALENGSTSLLSEILEQYHGAEQDIYVRNSVIEATISVVSAYRMDVPVEVLLSLVTYCVMDCGSVDLERWADALHVYFRTKTSQIRIWSIALYLDRAVHDEDSLKLAESLWNMDTETRSLLPITFVDKLVTLGHSEKALALLSQMLINPQNKSDVLGCIRILLANNLIAECFIRVREHLQQLSLIFTESQWKEAAHMFWNEICTYSYKYGLLFQMIRLPISISVEEHVVVEWLENAHKTGKNSQFLRALCLYFIARGRVEEAKNYYDRMNIDPEDEWDSYLQQLVDLASQFEVKQEQVGGRRSFFLLQADNRTKSKIQSHSLSTASNILFKPAPSLKNNETLQSRPLGSLQTSARKPTRDLLRHGTKKLSDKGASHTLDKLLEI